MAKYILEEVIKMNKTLTCEKCGQVEFGLVDGYCFGDRLLEDVMLAARLDLKGKFKVKISPDSKDYFEELNTKKWLKTALDYVKEDDLLICPKCQDHRIPINQPKGFKPLPIKTIRFDDLMRELK